MVVMCITHLFHKKCIDIAFASNGDVSKYFRTGRETKHKQSINQLYSFILSRTNVESFIKLYSFMLSRTIFPSFVLSFIKGMIFVYDMRYSSKYQDLCRGHY